jgi:hypothetical protein
VKTLVLYCKSYRTDLKRVIRLAESVTKFNAEKLDFFVSVPSVDLELFRAELKAFGIILISDEEVIKKNSNISLDLFQNLPGHIAQQIVKSEFWRVCEESSYLCLDSDSFFIRPFFSNDFINNEGIPYTVINEAQELQLEALRLGKPEVIDNFIRESKLLMNYFQREGKNYSFGPMPMAWHRAVWESLDEAYLKPRGLSFMDAILKAPLESRWYGEALLKFKAVPLLPCEPFFKVYHYAWQLDKDQKQGVTQQHLARLYSGVIYQSAWERELDWPAEGGHAMSRFGRRLRRTLGRM